MPTDRGEERAFVGDDVSGPLGTYLSRVLEHATPDAWVAGGEREAKPFQRKPHKHATLERHAEIYDAGGPVADLTDKRALMTYGPGIEFQTEDESATDGQGRTVGEWLDDAFGDRFDYTQIQLGVQSYWAGTAWAEVVESRDGGFSHLHPIDPTTVDPEWDRHGELTGVDQVVTIDGKVRRQPLDEDRVFPFSFKNTPGGPVETGLYDRNADLIERYAQNQVQRKNAIRLHGSPHYHIQVGSEGQSIPDKIIRRIRNRFSSEETDEKTNWVTGGEIGIEELDAPGFEGMQSITETDMALLAEGFGIPLELTNFGSDGLGSGKPAEVRWSGFERQARAEQTLRAAQLMDVVRYILEEYSPFARDIDVSAVFGDVVSDQQAAMEWMQHAKSYMTPDEVRERLDLQPVEDESGLGPPEGTPDAEAGGQDIGGGAGGLFADDPGSDAPDPLADDAVAKRAHTDGGQRAVHRQLLHTAVEHGKLTQEELVWEDIFERVLWHEDTERQLFEFDPEEVPDFAVERLRDAVRAGALFDNFGSIPDWAASRVGDTMLDSLDNAHGWSINSIQDNLLDMNLGLDDRDAEVIARTETQALVNAAREEGYKEEFDLDEERFDWVGPTDDRTTDACEWIKSQIPDEGVRMETLKELIQEANDRFIDSHDARTWTPHIQCRHSYTRQV